MMILVDYIIKTPHLLKINFEYYLIFLIKLYHGKCHIKKAPLSHITIWIRLLIKIYWNRNIDENYDKLSEQFRNKKERVN